MATYKGARACQQCGKPVSVYADKNGFGYYKCGPCGFSGKQSDSRMNQAFLKTVQRDADEEEAPNTPPESSTATPPAHESPEGVGKRRAGFFDGLGL